MIRPLLWILFFLPLSLLAQEQRILVDSIYNFLTLDQKIGQLFMIMVNPDRDAVKRKQHLDQIQQQHVGAIVFSKGTAAQQQIDTKVYQYHSRIPLLVGADAEWGMAMRLSDVSPYPYAMTLGALPHNDLIYALGKRMGERQRHMGVHVSFSPVADVNINPDNPIVGVRSFGDDPVRVSTKAIALMEGLQDAGVLAVAKHFPGHGASGKDSHKTLAKINRSKAALDAVELVPFKQLIEKGVKGIMIGHLSVTALESNISAPVSASEAVVSTLLKNKMGFEGLVFTDALNMSGITNYVTHPSLSCFMAGADVLVMPVNLKKAILSIKDAYLSGSISSTRLEHSVKKIIGAKYNAQLFKQHQKPPSSASLNPTFYDHYLKKKIAEQSIVLIHQDKNSFPIESHSSIGYVVIGSPNDTIFLESLSGYGTLSQLSIADAKLSANLFDKIIVGIFIDTSTPWERQSISRFERKILNELSMHPNVHVVLFGNSYGLSLLSPLDRFSSVILAHEQQEAFKKGAAKILFGKLSAIGTLPINIQQ